MEEEGSFNVHEHVLVPKHEKLTESDIDKLLQRYNIELPALPLIAPSDPALQNLNVKIGDVIKIERQSLTAGDAVYYRRVGEILKSDTKTAEEVELLKSLKPKKKKVAKKKVTKKKVVVKKKATKKKVTKVTKKK